MGLPYEIKRDGTKEDISLDIRKIRAEKAKAFENTKNTKKSPYSGNLDIHCKA